MMMSDQRESFDDDRQLLPPSNTVARPHDHGALGPSPQDPVRLDPESGNAPEDAGRLVSDAAEAGDSDGSPVPRSRADHRPLRRGRRGAEAAPRRNSISVYIVSQYTLNDRCQCIYM